MGDKSGYTDGNGELNIVNQIKAEEDNYSDDGHVSGYSESEGQLVNQDAAD